MKTLICFATVALGFSASAAVQYYWAGNAQTDPADTNYYRTVQSSMDLTKGDPAPAFDGIDVMMSQSNQEVVFTDESIWALMKMHSFRLRTGAKIYIDVTNDYTFAFRPHNWADGYIIKRGPGTIEFTNDDSDIDTSNRHNAFQEKWIVEEGRVTFPQDGLVVGLSYFLAGLVVSNNAEVILFGGRTTAEKGKVQIYIQNEMSGGGDIAYTNATQEGYLIVAGASANPFSGRLRGDKLEFRPSGAALTGVENTYKQGNYVGGYFGARKFGNEENAPSSMGYGSSRTTLNGSVIRLHNLATAADGPQSSTRRYWDALGSGTVTFDGGAYGALTLYDGHIYPTFGLAMKELILTGSNTEECVFSTRVCCNVDSDAPSKGFYYLTKRGTGTWHMTTRGESRRYKIAGVAIEEGTLKADSLAERGTAYSLGLATNTLGYAYQGAIAKMPAEAPFAIRLGTATDLTKEGELAYTGASAVNVSTRPIGVIGKGRLTNATDLKFQYSGLLAAVPPEGGEAPANTLTLDGDSMTAMNELSEISEQAGAGALSITKDGAGAWNLGGNIDFSGDVTVNEGSLSIANFSHYTWYRFTITESLAGSDHPVAGKTAGATYSVLGELGLFAADGTRQNAGLEKWAGVEAGAAAGRMAPGCAAYGRTGVNEGKDKGLARLFDGVGDNEWYASQGVVTTTNAATQCPIVMRLPNAAKPIASMDICHPYGLTGAYENAKATQFTLEGSADGKVWHMITNVTDLVLRKEDGWSYANANIAPADTPVSGTLALSDTTIPAAERLTVLPNGLSKLKVAAGASFAVWGDAIPVKALELDAAGVGSITGVSFPATGTINVTGVKATDHVTRVPFDFSSLAGSANLANWTVLVDGSAVDPQKLQVEVTPTGLELRRFGMMFILR